MSSHGNGQHSRYRVILSGKLSEEVTRLHQRALDLGTAECFTSALRTIGQKLRDHPLSFGEALYRLPALKLIVCAGAIYPIARDFGVHEERPLVIVRGIRFLGDD